MKAQQKTNQLNNITVKRPAIYDVALTVIIVFLLFDINYSNSEIKIKFINNFNLIIPLVIFVSSYLLLFVRKVKVEDEKIIFIYCFYKFCYKKKIIEKIKIKHDMRFPYIQVIIKDNGKRKFYYCGINTTPIEQVLSP